MSLATGRMILQRAAVASRNDAGESSICVAFSGGKDSLAVLDLCTRYFDRVSAFFMYLVPNLECEEVRLRAAERRWGVEIRRMPHFMCAEYLKWGIASTHRNGASHRVRDIKYVDIERRAKDLADCQWAAAGQRSTDSLERRAMLHKVEGYDANARRVYPIWDWKTKDVEAYLKHRNIPFPKPVIPGRKNMDGVSLLPESLAALKQYHPGDYAKVIEFFPFAEAMLAREEFRQVWDPKQVPEVRDGAVEPS